MIAGVDGCRAGWMTVFRDETGYGFQLFREFRYLLELTGLERVLIDIPVGLGSLSFPRGVDNLLRKALPGRGSTVFNVPCRAAVYECDFQKARELNLSEQGKSLSVQSLNICGKIREVDRCLPLAGPPYLYECHPELGFRTLNAGKVVMSRKSTAEGFRERLDLIRRIDPDLAALFPRMRESLKKTEAKDDDLLDASCLYLINHLAGPAGLSFLQDDHQADEKGIPLRIAYLKKLG